MTSRPAQLEQIDQINERFEALCRRISDAWADTPAPQGMAEIEAAIAAQRGKPARAALGTEASSSPPVKPLDYGSSCSG